jgi:hypothetical protein
MRRSRIGVLQAEWSTDTETNLQKMESLVTRLHSEWGDQNERRLTLQHGASLQPRRPDRSSLSKDPSVVSSAIRPRLSSSALTQPCNHREEA